MDEESIITTLTILAQTYADTANRLIKDYPDWDHRRDERVLIFVKCANALSSIKMGLIFSRDYLSQPEWWKQYPELQNSVDADPNRAMEFEILMKASLAVFVFSIQEAALRCFVKAIEPTKSDLASGEFGNVFPFLLKRIYGSDQKRHKYEELLRLWSLIRNSVHNNFVFAHPSGIDKKCKYRNKEYIFQIDHPVPFLNWELFLLVTADLGDLLSNMVRTPELSGLRLVKTPVDRNLYRPSSNDK